LDRVVLQALKAELARISVKAYERRLVFGTGGNISVRIPNTGLALITPTGVSLGDTTVDNISIIDIETGEPTPDSPTKPSKERYFHAAIYRIREDVNALCHLHPPYATAWSTRGKDHGAGQPGEGPVRPVRALGLHGPDGLRDRGGAREPRHQVNVDV
jgi:ribulose-5-phosphate 4-epimerase/fuculose-1-phosphate aldolase